MSNSYDTKFDAPEAYFDNLSLISDAQAEKKKMEIRNDLIVTIP
jgi:hypothetical protein